MKLFLLLFINMGLGLVALAQPIQIKGFIQSSSPGNIPQNTANENVRSAVGAQDVYFIYLIHSKNEKLTPVEMWINGQHYGIKALAKATPVEQENNALPNQKKIILVPKTNNKVWQLEPVTSPVIKMATVAHKAKTNALVVVYKRNGKLSSLSVNKLTRLEPNFAQ